MLIAEAGPDWATMTCRFRLELPKLEPRSEPAGLPDPLAELLIFGLLAETGQHPAIIGQGTRRASAVMWLPSMAQLRWQNPAAGPGALARVQIR